MSVNSYTLHIYVCKCDVCGKIKEVKENYPRIYNGAQAVRSLGWSFGKDKNVKCSDCRKRAYNDHYQYR